MLGRPTRETQAPPEVERLLRQLRRRPRSGFRRSPAVSLTSVGAQLAGLGEAAVAPLLAELDELGDPGAVALAAIGRPALTAIARDLEGAPPRRRALLIHALGMSGLAEAVAPLRAQLAAADADARRAAGSALERLAKGFVRALGDGARREQAMLVLERIGAPAAWAVGDALRDPRRGLVAARVMGGIGEAAVEPAMTVFLQGGRSLTPHGDPAATYAAEALAQIGEPALDPLLAVLYDRRERPPLRAAAARALGDMGEIAEARLREALLVNEAFVRECAAAALGEDAPVE
ncbi:MAG: HEAT repeat domain-containing protein [Thermoleophilia bacterium]|jgi:HEAT repeat protein|nr:HEAT repeat domain-containing protein [Thermoleophilia bacterium]